MDNALLSDVEARAERRRTRTSDDLWRALGEDAWRRSRGAADPAVALAALERAHRILPGDALIAVALGGALLGAGLTERAATVFEAATLREELFEAWTGLAAARLRLGDRDAARRALAEALRRRVPDAAVLGLAAVLAPEGWCGLDTDGTLRTGPDGAGSEGGRSDGARSNGTIRVALDGREVRPEWSGAAARLPAGWERAAAVTVTLPSGPALGSPLPPSAFRAEGYAEGDGDDGVRGWAHYPADPSRNPALLLSGPGGERRLVADEPLQDLAGFRPFARPRRFAVAAGALAALGMPLALRFEDGRHLLGSPLAPGLEQRGGPAFAPSWADRRGPARTIRPRRRAADVVVPVHGGRKDALNCLRSVLASLPAGARLIVVDDASPDAALAAELDRLAAAHPAMRLLRLPENRGFPGAANAGLRSAGRRDAVLLNSDALVPPGWLERLAEAAYSAPDVGTVTPLTNDGTILSFPDPAGGNPMPDAAGTARLDALARRACGGATVDIPVGVGFCLYLRRDCLDAAGLLREDLFAQGYGEENDLCLRARHAGFRNVAAPGVFVAHRGAGSFGDARRHLIRRNEAVLERLHPGYGALVAAHLGADPLRAARRAVEALLWRAGLERSGGERSGRERSGREKAGAVLFVTHGGGGGVDRVVEARAARARAMGMRPVVLRPAPGGAVRVEEPGATRTPNLRFRLPGEWPELLRLLRADRPARVELHHFLGHDAALAGLGARLGVPSVSVVHDYARFCPRIALVSTGKRYCGEPDVRGCEDCVADLGSLLEDDPPVRTLLERSAAELGAAAAVLAPSRDAAARMERHFPGIRITVEPWENDGALPSPSPSPLGGDGEPRRIVVVGAIGVEKGFEVLLGCARDARARSLPLHFTVVGFTADDLRLLDAGPVAITGRYAEAEAAGLIRAQAGHLAFIPSVWPETWCFALSRAWEAGLPAAVFDLGAQAERVRRTGRGWTVPLGLSPAGVNDLLLRLAPDRLPGQSPAAF